MSHYILYIALVKKKIVPYEKSLPGSPYWTDDMNPGNQPDGEFSEEMNKQFITKLPVVLTVEYKAPENLKVTKLLSLEIEIPVCVKGL